MLLVGFASLIAPVDKLNAQSMWGVRGVVVTNRVFQDYLGTIHADVRYRTVCAISFGNDWNNLYLTVTAESSLTLSWRFMLVARCATISWYSCVRIFICDQSMQNHGCCIQCR
jgi:hypothetical protein